MPISFDSVISSAVQQLGSSQSGSVQQAAQVSVLKQANDAQAHAALALISGIGQKLDVKG
jgi:hypothetical protein